ncbi:hypothetical protein [Bartonella ancashensis]|uniref:Holliday junction DNA helicase RuvB n=1 Tax=Bartonella ancashensis TaxID=1318743 RepID=A0A0M4LIY5_9HYPH|nr:hypothetical protein [Bartonella ancashensis]ALE03127.1 Holliday junction DNA helicase RuvB [Bartonella ancashensis]
MTDTPQNTSSYIHSFHNLQAWAHLELPAPTQTGSRQDIAAPHSQSSKQPDLWKQNND